jgi:hypothetical protein
VQPHRFGRGTLLVAADPATAVADKLRRFASATLAPGGTACLLLNGGRAGASARAWVRREADASPLARGARESTDSRAALLAASDAALGLVEAHDFAPPLTEGERSIRDAFDRSALEEFAGLCETVR